MQSDISLATLFPQQSAGVQELLALATAQRCTRTVTLLASAARTTAVSSADQTNYDATEILVWINITAASGTGGLQLYLDCKDPISGSYFRANVLPTALTSTGLRGYLWGRSITSLNPNFNQVACLVIPRTWRLSVAVGDASSYTYSVSACLIG